MFEFVDTYPLSNPSVEEQQAALHFFSSIGQLYTCGPCRRHYQQKFDLTEDIVAAGRDRLMSYLIQKYNDVQTMNKKPVTNMEYINKRFALLRSGKILRSVLQFQYSPSPGVEESISLPLTPIDIDQLLTKQLTDYSRSPTTTRTYTIEMKWVWGAACVVVALLIYHVVMKRDKENNNTKKKHLRRVNS